MAESQLTTCSYCGTQFHKKFGQTRCEYCGADLRQSPPTASAPPPAVSGAPASSSQFDLSQFQRPKPSMPLASGGCFSVFGLAWTLFSAVFLLIGIGTFVTDQLNYNQLVREGIPTMASITQLEEDDSGDSTAYYVHYQYRARLNGDYARFEASDTISYSAYKSFKPGQQIEIIYAESDPTLTVLKSGFSPPNLIFPLAFIAMGGLFSLIGVGILVMGTKSIWNLNQLRQKGRETRAVVFDRWVVSGSDSDSHYIALAFRAPAANGELKIITYAEQNEKLYNQCKPGDVLTVRYLPENPLICQPRRDRQPTLPK